MSGRCMSCDSRLPEWDTTDGICDGCRQLCDTFLSCYIFIYLDPLFELFVISFG